jgi:hypothetical protein
MQLADLMSYTQFLSSSEVLDVSMLDLNIGAREPSIGRVASAH